MSGYRGIRPVLPYNEHIHPLNRPQFVWQQAGEGCEVASYAGKEMAAYLHEDGRYALTYLDLAYPQRFATIERAKEAAPEFARAVLLTMLNFIGVDDEDVELKYCLRVFGLDPDEA